MSQILPFAKGNFRNEWYEKGKNKSICSINRTNQTKLQNITTVINCIANNCENRVSFANTHNDNYQNNCLE